MAEGTDGRMTRENGGRPGGNHGGNGKRRHRGHRSFNNQNRFNNSTHEGSDQNRPSAGVEAVSKQEGYRAANHHNAYYAKRDGFNGGARDFGKRAEQVKAHETLEDIQQDILRIQKEIELEVSEISAIKLGV